MVRYKNRYLTIKVSLKNKADQSLNLQVTDLHNAIQTKVWDMYGDFGVAAIKSGFSAKYVNSHTKIALIQIRHGPHKFLLNAIPKVIDVGGKHVSVKIIYVGATLKHCFIFIKKYQTRKLESLWSKINGAKEKKDLEKSLMTMTPAMKDFMQNK